MIILKYVEYAVLVLSYVGIGLGYLPGLRIQVYTLTFWEHLRFGLPLTIITLVITYFWVK